MSVHEESLTKVWCEVQAWPMKSQLTLASRILQSVQHGIEGVKAERRKSLVDLIGILKTDNPPNDTEVERIVEEERLRKYG